MEQHPEILGDLWALYQIDFWDWIWRPRLDVLIQCINRLSAEPWSHYRAGLLGGDGWLGWGTAESQRADQFDALVFVAHAAGQNKGAKFKPTAPRPEQKKSKTISTRSNVGAALAGLRS